MSQDNEVYGSTDLSQTVDSKDALEMKIEALEQRVIALEKSASERPQADAFLSVVGQRLNAAWTALLGRKDPVPSIASADGAKTVIAGVPVNVILLVGLAVVLLAVIFD